MIVVIDGLDGAGKSTQSSALQQWIADQGVSCRTVSKWDVCARTGMPETRFLRGTDRSELRLCIAEMPSPARLLFLMWMYAEATVEAERLSRDGVDVVILDGCWMKHAAAELALGAAPADVASITAAMPVPGTVLYLDVSPAVALARKEGDLTPYESGIDPECRPERFLAQQKRIREQMTEWCDTFGWIRIDTEAGTAAVQMAMREFVGSLLPVKGER